MANQARLRYSVQSWSPTGLETNHDSDIISWSPAAALANGQRQIISLPGSTYTPITVPLGSKLMVLILAQAVSLTLKGNTADVGVPLTPASSPIGVDLILPVDGGATPGILNGSVTAQTIEALFY